MAKIPNSDQSQNTSRIYKSEGKNGLTRTPRYTRGGIRCLGGVSIPCWSITPAVSPVLWSWMRSYQVRSYYWYEKCQTTYGSMKVCNYKLDHCNGHRTCDTNIARRECINCNATQCFLVLYHRLQNYYLCKSTIYYRIRHSFWRIYWCVSSGYLITTWIKRGSLWINCPTFTNR
jgi:hypothetical protein